LTEAVSKKHRVLEKKASQGEAPDYDADKDAEAGKGLMTPN